MPSLDLKNYKGREQAYVKHFLLEKYLAPLAFKVGSAWGSVVYIDGFSGPWDVRDEKMADSSFGIAVDTLRRVHSELSSRGKNIRMQSILVEQDKTAFVKLEAFALSKNNRLRSTCILWRIY